MSSIRESLQFEGCVKLSAFMAPMCCPDTFATALGYKILKDQLPALEAFGRIATNKTSIEGLPDNELTRDVLCLSVLWWLFKHPNSFVAVGVLDDWGAAEWEKCATRIIQRNDAVLGRSVFFTSHNKLEILWHAGWGFRVLNLRDHEQAKLYATAAIPEDRPVIGLELGVRRRSPDLGLPVAPGVARIVTFDVSSFS